MKSTLPDNNMRKLLALICLCCMSYLSYAQRFHNSIVERITADGVTYELEKTAATYFFTNVNNAPTSWPYVKLDGTPATGTWADYDAGELDKDAVERIIREVFTARELTDFKATDTYMVIHLTFDNHGKVIKTSFNFKATAPVQSLPIARIAQLEKRLKAEVTTCITDPATKELRFIGDSYGYRFKRMDD